MISFRNQKAAIICPDDKDRHVLQDRLSRLGLVVQSEADWGPSLVAWQPDVVFFDVDSGNGDLAHRIGSAESRPLIGPLIGIVGAESPSRLEWMLQQRPSAYLLRPIRSSGVYTALVMGYHNASDRRELVAQVTRLERRAQARRTVFAATTRLMTAHGLTEPDAYRLLREAAMRQRTTIEEVSARIEANATGGIAAVIGS